MLDIFERHALVDGAIQSEARGNFFRTHDLTGVDRSVIFVDEQLTI